MGKILEVKTVQANVIKILSEALKDLVPDVNLIFTKSVPFVLIKLISTPSIDVPVITPKTLSFEFLLIFNQI